MKIKQIKDPIITYNSITEPLDRQDVIDDITDKFNFLDERYAHVVYLYGTGGIGKTYICRSLDKYITKFPEKISSSLETYSVYYDLFKNSEYPAKLMELASLIEESLNVFNLFEDFKYVFKIYIKRYQQQWDNQNNSNSSSNSLYDIAMGIGSFVPIVSELTGFVQILGSAKRYITDKIKDKKLQDMYNKLENIPLDDLRQQLCIYFVNDLNNYFKNYKYKRIVIILDTFESLTYKDNLQYNDYKCTDWLLGDDGIIRLLTNTTWVIAGRDKIDWKIYDKENYEDSFNDIIIKKPLRPEVVNFLTKTGMDKKFAEKIADETNCFPLKFGMYLNLYMKFLRHKQEMNNTISENHVLDDEEFQKISEIVDGDSLISNRFFYHYFNRQERDIIYTLACLKSWDDEILNNVIWKDNFVNFSLYETIKEFSFIEKVGSTYEMKTTLLPALITDCPINLKKKLIHCIIDAIQNNDYFAQNINLFKSLLHINLYTQIEIEFYEDLMQCLYKILNPIFKFLELKVIDDFCEDCINLLNKYKTMDVNYYLFRVNILIYKYICRQIYEVRRKKFLKKETIDFYKEIKDSLDYLNEEDLEQGVYYTLDLVYEFSKKFSLFRDACNLMELFIVKYCNLENQTIDDKIFRYKTYCKAVVIKAKFYARSWAEYEDHVYNTHIIDIKDEESAFELLKTLIEFIGQNHYDKEELLKDLIFYYIQSVSFNLYHKIQDAIFTRDKKLEKQKESIEKDMEEHEIKLIKNEIEEHLDELIKNDFGHKESINRYLSIYKANADNKDIREQINVKYLECSVNFAENNFKETVRLTLRFMHEKIIEFGTELVYTNYFIDLFKYASKSLACIELEQNFIDEFSSVKKSYEKLFNFVLTEFCKTCNLNYLNILETLNNINKYLFPDINSTWCERILSINKIIADSFTKNFILLGLQHYCEFIHNNTYFNVSGKQNILLETELSEPLTSEQVQVVLNYMYINNRICKEITQDLIIKFHSTTGDDKASAGYALLVFYDKIATISYKRCINKEEAHLYSIVLRRTNIKNLAILREQLLAKSFEDFTDHIRTCFDHFTGWIFHQNFIDDRKFLQNCFDIIYEFMVTKPVLEGCDSNNLTLFDEFYNIINFVLQKFIDIKDFISLGYNLLKYIKYATDYDGTEHHVKSEFIEEKVMEWINKMKKYFASKFNQDPKLVKELATYGLLCPLEASENFNVGDLLLVGKFDKAKIYWKEYSINNQSNLDYIILKDIYEPILFKPKEKIHLFLEEIKNKIFSEETRIKLYSKDEDGISSTKICKYQFMLIEGYKFYKSEKNFLSLTKQILPYLTEVLFINTNVAFFEYIEDPIIDILKYLMPIKAYDQVRYLVSELFRKEEELNSIEKLKYEQKPSHSLHYIPRTQLRYAILKNFNIISEIYKASELFSNVLIGEIICDNSFRCISVYNALKGYLQEEHLRELILESSAPILDEIFETGKYSLSNGGLDGIHYRKLREIFGDDLDRELKRKIPYFVEARKIYLKNYKIYD